MVRWQANADDIGTFLGTANPDNWPAADMKAMMRQHLDLTTAEVVARLNKDWAGDIAAYDNVHLHILVLADELTNGIVAQFPDAFEDPRHGSARMSFQAPVCAPRARGGGHGVVPVRAGLSAPIRRRPILSLLLAASGCGRSGGDALVHHRVGAIGAAGPLQRPGSALSRAVSNAH